MIALLNGMKRELAMVACGVICLGFSRPGRSGLRCARRGRRGVRTFEGGVGSGPPLRSRLAQSETSRGA